MAVFAACNRGTSMHSALEKICYQESPADPNAQRGVRHRALSGLDFAQDYPDHCLEVFLLVGKHGLSYV